MLKGERFRVVIKHPLQSLVFWLAGEKSPLLDVRELAKDWFGLRGAPSSEQIVLAKAIVDAFLTGRKDWTAWDFIGKATRRLPEERLLEMRREELRGRLRRDRIVS